MFVIQNPKYNFKVKYYYLMFVLNLRRVKFERYFQMVYKTSVLTAYDLEKRYDATFRGGMLRRHRRIIRERRIDDDFLYCI